jgi:Zn-finger nucleic acid-binding protein
MYCPTCKTLEHSDVHFTSGDFKEDMDKCPICGTVWSVNHGTVEVIKDSQEKSFLSTLTECVECDDYNMAYAG